MNTPIIVIVMGVSGCGKSTVGAALARELGATFLDADDFHPAANKEKMRRGEPLNDDDRAPWLAQLNAELLSRFNASICTVLACSALKERYRAVLRQNLPTVQFVHLVGTAEEIGTRLAGRRHEYMPASLLASQFEALEKPLDAIEIPVRWSVTEQVTFAKQALLRHNSPFVGV